MNVNPQTHLNAVDRSVSFFERDEQPASSLTLSRTFATTVEDLWDAVTDPDRIPLWFIPITGDLQLNGRYQLEHNASGSIIECEPQSHFALTWEFAGDVSWVDVHLASVDPDHIRLILTHTAHISEHWDTYGPGATGVGWEMGLLGLALYIADPNFQKPDPNEFAFSHDGKAMLTDSSDAWAQAAIVAGTDPETAQTAANQTTAFYTGQTTETT